jgi:hypothetical protein
MHRGAGEEAYAFDPMIHTQRVDDDDDDDVKDDALSS